MQTYQLNAQVLKRLCTLNQFEIPKVDMVFFGIRGSLPAKQDDFSFAKQKQLNLIELSKINYVNFNCTIGQWKLKDDTIAVYTASTVPARKNIEKFGGANTNQMITGYYLDYTKGLHPEKTSETDVYAYRHEAFRQTVDRPVRRTYNNSTFDNADEMSYGMQNDNLHAAHRIKLDANIEATQGCQIVHGRPDCDAYKGQGAWLAFYKEAYGISQISFPYFLLTGERDFYPVAVGLSQRRQIRLRYGSSGTWVRQVQERLKRLQNKDLVITSNFDIETLKAVIAFQTAQFGVFQADGIIGNQTASRLGITLPTI
jgi:hypothetical protein